MLVLAMRGFTEATALHNVSGAHRSVHRLKNQVSIFGADSSALSAHTFKPSVKLQRTRGKHPSKLFVTTHLHVRGCDSQIHANGGHFSPTWDCGIQSAKDGL